MSKKPTTTASKPAKSLANPAPTKPDTLCIVADCKKGRACRGLCHGHYEALARAVRNNVLTFEAAEQAGACLPGKKKVGNALVRHFPMLANVLAGKGEKSKPAPNIALPATDVLPRDRRPVVGRCTSCN